MDGMFTLNAFGKESFVPSEEQMLICEAVKRGGNHVIWGEAGTGKTSLIRFLVDELRGMGRQVLCVAPTGIAAQNLNIAGAMTIHRAFQLPAEMSEAALEAPPAPWLCHFNTLVIDEIGMVRSDVFATMDRLLQNARSNCVSFGGVQVIAVGDIMQLPPFAPSRELEKYLTDQYGSLHCFNTSAWNRAGLVPHRLTAVYRQAGDREFFQLLHTIHSGDIARCEVARLGDSLVVNGMPGRGEPECHLTYLKEDANRFNQTMLDNLPGLPLMFRGKIDGYFPSNELPVEETLKLKMGCKVLLVANGYENGRLLYANGDFGTFLRECDGRLLVRLERTGQEIEVAKNTWPRYAYQGDGISCIPYITGTFEQFPVLLGYAITVNRSQGMTLPGHINIEVPFDRTMPPGVLYTALSRARSLEQLSCSRMIAPEDLKPSPEVREFMERYRLG